MKKTYHAYVSIGDGLAWCIDKFDDLESAIRAADAESDKAYVVEITREVVHRNGKGGEDKHRPIKDALAKVPAA